jgi:imidazole glycerol-phosphate synthase subunit HisH
VIVVVDYGVNNLKSVVRALAAGGHAAVLSAEPDQVRSADHLLMPGVGNFGQAIRNLAASGLGEAVRDVARAGKPVLGICLGMQLFFRRSEEAPEETGLGILEGEVVRFRTSLPVPHVGWAEVTLTEAGRRHPMLPPLFPEGRAFFYHVHSYHPAALPEGAALAEGDYGGRFATIVGRGNVLGAQFHPEKSQRAGIDLLSRFVSWRP